MSGRAPGCQEEPSQLKGKRKSFPNLSFLKLHRCAEVFRAITGAQPPTHPWCTRQEALARQRKHGFISRRNPRKSDPNSLKASLHQRKRGKSLGNAPVSVEMALPASKSSLLPQPFTWSVLPWPSQGKGCDGKSCPTLLSNSAELQWAASFMELQPQARAPSGSPRGRAKNCTPHRHFCSDCLITVAKRQLRLAPSFANSKWNSLVFSLFSPFPAGQQIFVPAKYPPELPSS